MTPFKKVKERELIKRVYKNMIYLRRITPRNYSALTQNVVGIVNRYSQIFARFHRVS